MEYSEQKNFLDSLWAYQLRFFLLLCPNCSLFFTNIRMNLTTYQINCQKEKIHLWQVSGSVQCLWHPMDCNPPGSSVHGLLQARILEWAVIPFSRGSSRSSVQTWVSCIFQADSLQSEPSSQHKRESNIYTRKDLMKSVLLGGWGSSMEKVNISVRLWRPGGIWTVTECHTSTTTQTEGTPYTETQGQMSWGVREARQKAPVL